MSLKWRVFLWQVGVFGGLIFLCYFFLGSSAAEGIDYTEYLAIGLYILAVLPAALLSYLGLPTIEKSDSWFPGPTPLGWTLDVVVYLLIFYAVAVFVAWARTTGRGNKLLWGIVLAVLLVVFLVLLKEINGCLIC
jgi:hypothetical protein